MTSNQIEYAKLLETRRNNLAQEGITSLRDQRSHDVAVSTLDETRRANTERERQNRASLDETSRSNRVKEQLESDRNKETRRSNLASEAETKRSNVAREMENNRANVAKEIELNRHQTAVENETKRSNQARELHENLSLAETLRSNLSRESETARHNRASESSEAIKAGSYAARAAEMMRHNLVMESKDLKPSINVNASGGTVSGGNQQNYQSNSSPINPNSSTKYDTGNGTSGRKSHEIDLNILGPLFDFHSSSSEGNKTGYKSFGGKRNGK